MNTFGHSFVSKNLRRSHSGFSKQKFPHFEVLKSYLSTMTELKTNLIKCLLCDLRNISLIHISLNFRLRLLEHIYYFCCFEQNGVACVKLRLLEQIYYFCCFEPNGVAWVKVHPVSDISAKPEFAVRGGELDGKEGQRKDNPCYRWFSREGYGGATSWN